MPGQWAYPHTWRVQGLHPGHCEGKPNKGIVNKTCVPKHFRDEHERCTYLDSQGDCSAAAADEHVVVPSLQTLVLLVHRIQERHPALIPDGEGDRGFAVEPSLTASFAAVRRLGD